MAAVMIIEVSDSDGVHYDFNDNAADNDDNATKILIVIKQK